MRTLLTATLLLALTACGSSDDSDLSNDDASASTSTPKCADVLKVGETLPESYEGCEDDEGSIVPVLVYDCDDGREFWALSDSDLVTFVGEPIAEDPDGELFSECKPS